MKTILNDKAFTENEFLIIHSCLMLPGKLPTNELQHIDYWAGEERGILDRHGFNIGKMSPLCANFYKACKQLINEKPVSNPMLTKDEVNNVFIADQDHKVTKGMLIAYCDKLGLVKARKGHSFVFVSYESPKRDLIHILKYSLGATD